MLMLDDSATSHFLLSLNRYFWEESDPVCLGVHHTLPGSAHLIHFPLQHVHEGMRAQLPYTH